MDDSIKKQGIKCDIMEKLEEQVFKISRLIFKEVTGTISDEEQRYLEWWRGRNPDNERLYRELKDGQRVMGEVKQLEGVEVIRPLEGMHLRIREEERRLRQRRWQWGVAAAAVAFGAGHVADGRPRFPRCADRHACPAGRRFPGDGQRPV